VDLGTIQYNVEANTTGLNEAETAMDSVIDKAEETGVVVDGMSKKITASATAASSATRSIKNDYGSLAADLRRQADLYGETSQAARLRYDIEQGALSDLTTAQKAHLVTLAQNVDSVRDAAVATEMLARQERELAEQAKMASMALTQQAEAVEAALRKEIALYGETGKAARLAYEMQHGALKNLSNEQKQSINAMAKHLDMLDAGGNAALQNAKATEAQATAFRGLRGQAQNLGWQLQDIAVQAQMGTSAFVIFSQQGSQLVSTMGKSGPLIGALIAVSGAIGGVLFSSLMTTGKAMEDMADRAKELTQNMHDLTEAQKAVVQAATRFSISDTEKKYSDLSKTIQDQQKKVAELTESHGKLVAVYGASGRVNFEVANNTRMIEDATRGLVALQVEQVSVEKELQDLRGGGDQSKNKGMLSALQQEFELIGLTSKALYEKQAAQKGLIGFQAQEYIQTKLNIDAAEARVKADEDAAKASEKLAEDAIKKEAQRADSIQKMIDQLAKEAELMGNSSKEAEIRYGLSNGLIEAYGDEADALIRNAQAIDAQREAMKRANVEAGLMADFEAALGKENKQWEAVAKQNEEFEKLISSVDNFGGAWTRTGSIVADQLGTMVDGLNDYMSQLDALAAAEKDVAKAILEAKNPEQVAKAEKAATKLSQERQKAEISGYRSMAGAAATMFKENSKGRKALHAVEKTLAAVELAMAIKNTATELSLSATRSAAATAETGVNVAAGGAKMFAQSGWAGFAGVAAMVAAMASLGYSGGGGGGGGMSPEDIQAGQGTGTVLGSDEKSESISAAFDSFSDIAVDQLVELRGIRESLAKFNGGIAQLSLGVAASGLTEGKYINFTNQYVGDIIDRGGLKTRGSRWQDQAARMAIAPLQGQISDIFGFIQESINSATGALEIAQSNPAWAFISDIGKVSFEGMSGEEIQSELEAIFSQQADLITEFVVPSMKEYQQMGEGLFETLTRVAKEQAVFNDYMDKMGLSMQGVSSLMAIDMAQSIADMMGGFENFTDAAAQYIDKFFSEEEKFGMLQRSLSETFGALGKELPTTTEAFRKLVEEAHKVGDQELFAALLEINPAFAEFIEQMEGMKEATTDFSAAAKDSFSALQASISAERKRIQDIVSGAGTAKSALDKAVADEKSTLKTAYDERVNQIKAMADAEKEAQSAINKARIDSLNDERDAVQDRIGALSGLFDDLNRSIFDIALKSDELTRARRNAASFEIDTALSNARAGRGLPMDGQLSQALDILRDNPSSLYATAEDMAFETAKLQNKLTELAGLTGDQLSREEKSLLAIDAQIANAEASSKFYETATTKYDEMIEQATKQYDADVAAQDAILAKAQEQYDALTGIDTKALSVEAALIKYNESLLAADFENAQGQYERLDSLLSTGQSQLNAMLSIDDRILTLNDGVAKFIESINAAQSDQTNKDLLAQMQRMADEITQLREEQRSQAFAQQKALNTTAKNTTELVYA
jgi:hypothetical protein